MSYSLQTSLVIEGNRELFERASKAHRNPRKLMQSIGALVMGSAVRRLETVLSNDPEAVRTGRLAASIAISELDDHRVVVGSNVPYAAQVQHGGRIEPTAGKKALGIPLVDALKRNQIWPSELDPNRELLTFVPMRGGASGNVIGVLVDEEGVLGFGKGEALYALAKYVDQEARPFLYWDDENKRVISEELVPEWLKEG